MEPIKVEDIIDAVITAHINEMPETALDRLITMLVGRGEAEVIGSLDMKRAFAKNIYKAKITDNDIVSDVLGACIMTGIHKALEIAADNVTCVGCDPADVAGMQLDILDIEKLFV